MWNYRPVQSVPSLSSVLCPSVPSCSVVAVVVGCASVRSVVRPVVVVRSMSVRRVVRLIIINFCVYIYIYICMYMTHFKKAHPPPILSPLVYNSFRFVFQQLAEVDGTFAEV